MWVCSNIVQPYFGLWTLANKQITPQARAALSEYMKFVRVLENILQLIYKLFKAISIF